MIEVDCRISNLKYGYIIESMDNGLYALKYQIWDDGKSWNWNFPPGWVMYDNDGKQHIYQYLEDAKRDGNSFMIQQAAYQILEVGNMYVVWFWNENERDVSKQPIDNLIVYNECCQEVWKLSECFLQKEMCTGMHLTDINKIYVYTFSGIGMVIEINQNEVKCVDSKLVK